jgi:hypothetical protein
MYGLRPNHHGMVRCPFHDDRHPSLKLNEVYFYCFGCGTTGDVIDLTARFFALSPYEAARKLAADFGIDPDKPPSAAALAKPKHPMIRAFREDERYCQRVVDLMREKPLFQITRCETTVAVFGQIHCATYYSVKQQCIFINSYIFGKFQEVQQSCGQRWITIFLRRKSSRTGISLWTRASITLRYSFQGCGRSMPSAKETPERQQFSSLNI